MNALSSVSDAEFSLWVERHQHAVLRLCRSIVRDEHLGADAAQETFLRSWRRTRDERTPPHSFAWLSKVAIHTSLDFVRSRAARPVESVAHDELERQSARETNSLDALAESELRARFERALARLPEGQRTIFVLRHEGGLTLAEIAASLEVELSTVKTQFARAALNLQRRLAAFAPHSENES